MVLIPKSILEQIGGNHANLCKLLENYKHFFLFFSEYKTRWFVAILEILKWFAGHQIRNVAVYMYTSSQCKKTVVICWCTKLVPFGGTSPQIPKWFIKMLLFFFMICLSWLLEEYFCLNLGNS